MIQEKEIEQLAIDELQKLGYQYVKGAALAQERVSLSHVLLEGRLKQAMQKLNPHIPQDAFDDALRSIRDLATGDLLSQNKTFYKQLIEGVHVSYQQKTQTKDAYVRLIDFDEPRNNEWLAVNQYSVAAKGERIRFDTVLFVNGMPLVVMELKKASTIDGLQAAYQQLQNYQQRLPSLFYYNALMVISNGFAARAAPISAPLSRCALWKTTDGRLLAAPHQAELVTLIRGQLQQRVLLDLIRYFTVFTPSQTSTGQMMLQKKVAAYHQYYAVQKAITSTQKASGHHQKGGVVWHTQGAGKSLTMVFYAARIMQHLNNPTIVVITDRLNLDNQLFATFSSATALLREKPMQATSIQDLKHKLKRESGGIIFTTIQKFRNEAGDTPTDALTKRSNMIVIVDEAHRSQYGFQGKVTSQHDEKTDTLHLKTSYGFAKYMRSMLPNATYVAFTGTPLNLKDKNTRAVFGDYIDTYDISRAVQDGFTVPIKYEKHVVPLTLASTYEQILSPYKHRRTKQDIPLHKNQHRLTAIAKNIIAHFEQRDAWVKGKGMIVTQNRETAVCLYDIIIQQRPAWHHTAIDKGYIKVVMSKNPTADSPSLREHHTNEQEQETLATRIKDNQDPLKLVIVVNMWITGFDVPALHTLYLDKHIEAHNLMQTIARVNRVYQGKASGIIVDYCGIEKELTEAYNFYSLQGGHGQLVIDDAQSIQAVEHNLQEVREILNDQHRKTGEDILEEPTTYPHQGFHYQDYQAATNTAQKLSIITAAQEYLLKIQRKARFIQAVKALINAYTIAITSSALQQKAATIHEEIRFYNQIKQRLKALGRSPKDNLDDPTDIDALVDKAVSAGNIIDIFAAMGMEPPSLEHLSHALLNKIEQMTHTHTAIEGLKTLLEAEVTQTKYINRTHSRTLAERLEHAIQQYNEKSLTAAGMMHELLAMGKDAIAHQQKAHNLNLTPEVYAFYDAINPPNAQLVHTLGSDKLAALATTITKAIKEHATIDWTIRETQRDNLKRIVKRILRQNSYPQIHEAQAIDNVLKQAELSSI